VKTALLLMAHGSRQPEANDDLHQLAARLQEQHAFAMVESSFLELAQPSILEAALHCVEQGAHRIVMLPYFLSAGVHVRRDLTGLRDDLAARFPDIDFCLAEPLGQHPLLLEVVAARAREALEGRNCSNP
jgi:sirohydrochlorin ferrochelatase